MTADAPSFHIETLGCRVNQYDEEMLRREFFMRGFREVGLDDAADVYVINTCTVTRVADKKSRQMIRRALRANPEARVIATGCAVGNPDARTARVSPRVVEVSNKHKERLLDLVRAELPAHHERDERNLRDAVQGRARALLKVQDGCNQMCTFCIVPFVRGRARSKPPQEVLAEARQLVGAGYREIVVTGVHVGWYGRDIEGWDLGRLMALLSRESGAVRVRLSSIEPADFPLEMLDTMVDEGIICPHLHLALQHASDDVLARMRRGYTLAHYDAIVEAFLTRFPEGALTADVLVGFPGETEDDFERLCAYLTSRPFAHLHVFPYSVRPGTAAARMGGHLDERVLQARIDRVLAIARELEEAFRARFLGRTVKVLVEEHAVGRCRGTTDNYLTVEFEGDASLVGSIAAVEVDTLTPSGLAGVRPSVASR
ncbi:MAG: tRNA (N(6)-L-threonylcarbamoyladenosine(37)-C(2))-methylthiotransferase MtaB [Proteobacteria bacterium]|nr:tRNA (N(6)-L-threonylcarbamoyladenosine(37)-C(2))-methylthiotransferase MtaB [Pseudomonadota bacterium]